MMKPNYAIGTTRYHRLDAIKERTVCGRKVGKMKLVVRGTDCWPYEGCERCFAMPQAERDAIFEATGEV